MLQAFEAIIDERGQIRLLEPITLIKPQRAIVTILKEELMGNTHNLKQTDNPLKNSIVFEKDIVARLDMTWEADK